MSEEQEVTVESLFKRQEELLSRLNTESTNSESFQKEDVSDLKELITIQATLIQALVGDFVSLMQDFNELRKGSFELSITAQGMFNMLSNKGLITGEELMTERKAALERLYSKVNELKQKDECCEKCEGEECPPTCDK